MLGETALVTQMLQICCSGLMHPIRTFGDKNNEQMDAPYLIWGYIPMRSNADVTFFFLHPLYNSTHTKKLLLGTCFLHDNLEVQI